ncbi:MAG: EAL domain-containing protein [Thiobacillus sp.]|nr:EAL domain-containing protein [Thiobacillus sp.]
MNSRIDSAMAGLQARYRRNLLIYKEELNQAWAAFQLTQGADSVAALSHIAHRLAGSGKAYGFAELSRAARALEHACDEATALLPEQAQPALATLANALLAQLDHDADSSRKAPVPSGHPAYRPSAQDKPPGARLLVVDDDTDFSAQLCALLRGHGFHVHTLHTIEHFSDAVARFEPLAAIVDMDFYGARFAGAEEVFAWRQHDGAPLPMIFISGYESFHTRLAAARAGGNYFLSKPLDEARLLSLLKSELNISPDEPYRILLVDDDGDLLLLYESVLVQAGYQVFTATGAEEALATLEREWPELLLIDVHMPGCTGIELGQIIRQHEQFSHIPLLFMSAAADTDAKLACARLAHDEFITKPIEPWRLVMMVKSRVARSRRLGMIGLGQLGSEFDLQHDPLTALPTLKAFRQAIQAQLNELEPGEIFAVLKLDIRDFHTVNNLFGHFSGDHILQRLAWELSRCLSDNDLLCRESGDEFLVLTGRHASTDPVNQLAESLAAAIEKSPIAEDRILLALSADIGIALAPQDAADADNLLRGADTALFAARKSPNSEIRYFDASMQRAEEARFTLAQEIKQALQYGQFVAAYQPIFSVASGRVLGFEALARWKHPDKGVLDPADFIPLMEEQGLVSQLTVRMLDEALPQLARWQSREPGFFMSINLSARDIHKPVFIDHLKGLLSAYDLSPASVVLEITETVLLADWQRASEALASLRALGVQFALDDFGTGYSSLSYLNRIHAAKLKIDRSFLQSWSQSGDDQLIRAIVQLGHGLGLTVVAEGVETPAELSFLRELGCDCYQGYLSAKPMFEDEIGRAGWF